MKRRTTHRFFHGATLALAAALGAFVLAVGYARLAPPSPSLGSFLALVKLLALMALAAGASVLAVRVLARLPGWYLFVLACVLAVILYHFGGHPSWGVFWLAAFAVVPPTLLGGALALRGKLAALAALLGAAGLVYGLSYFLESGSPVPAPVNAASGAEHGLAPLDLPDPGAPGPLQVRALSYGSGEDRHRPEFGARADLRTDPVDGSKLVEGWEDLSGWARTQYWGFDASALPLQGRVWYPRGDGPFPLVLVVHGNHAMEDFSDEGYAYLGELLASRGIITVSVDENFLNSSFSGRLDELFGRGLRTENDARGWLLLKHLEQWKRWNETAGNPFFERVDMERIGLVGHSRGGEAVAVAAFFNDLERYPDDAELELGFDFGIRGVVAIAPVDGQYEPAGRATPLRNVDYFVIHGSHDGDVQSFAGSRQLERVRFDDGSFHFKSALYVYGANHGQFNTTWGRSDRSFPARNLLNLAQIMPEEDQVRVAEVYISAFFEIVLKDERAYLPLFRHAHAGGSWLPDTIYLTHYQDSTERAIAGFDEDLDVTTAALGGASLRAEGLATWRERLVEMKRDDKGTSAVRLGWERAGGDTSEEPPAYVVSFADGLAIAPGDAVVFALADAREEEEETEPLELSVELRGGSGAERLSVPLRVQPRLRVQVAKSDRFNRTATSEPVFQSYAIPVSARDPRSIQEIRFVFDRTEEGELLLDGLALRPR